MNRYACGTPIVYRRNRPGLEWEDLQAVYIAKIGDNKHRIRLIDTDKLRCVGWAAIRPVNGSGESRG